MTRAVARLVLSSLLAACNAVPAARQAEVRARCARQIREAVQAEYRDGMIADGFDPALADAESAWVHERIEPRIVPMCDCTIRELGGWRAVADRLDDPRFPADVWTSRDSDPATVHATVQCKRVQQDATFASLVRLDEREDFRKKWRAAHPAPTDGGAPTR